MRRQHTHASRGLLATLLSLVLVLGVTTQAFAAFGGGVGSKPGGGGSGKGGSTPVKGGGSTGGSTGTKPGGTSTAPADPTYSAWQWVSNSTFGSEPQCGTDANGQAAVGITINELIRYITSGVGAGTPQISSKTQTCLFPPGWTDSGSLTCIKTTNVAINITAPTTVALGSKSVTSAYASNPTVANCKASEDYLDLYVDPSPVGRYVFSGSQSRDRCTLRTFSSGYVNGVLTTPAPTLVNCAAIGNLSVYSVGEQSCTGWVSYNTGRTDWTSAECSNQRSSSPTYTCNIGTPKQNGVSGTNQSVLARGINVGGRANDLDYGSVSVGGGAISKLGSPTTMLTRGGTPTITSGSARSSWLTDVRVAGSQNSALQSSGASTPWLDGTITDWDIIYYQASAANQPSLINTQWRWANSSVMTSSVVITGFDPVTFALRTSTATKAITQTLVCQAPQVSFYALRGTTDVVP